jgi:tRNA G46 methylase TrmB
MEKELYKTLFETEKNHWWYSVRRKIVKDLIAKFWRNKDKPNLLDIGCGTGQLLVELSDVSVAAGGIAHKKPFISASNMA